MNELLIVASRDGVTTFSQGQGEWQLVHRALEDHEPTAVVAREGVILAGTTDGVFRSDDGGRSFQEASKGLAYKHVRWMSYDPEISDRELAGTEPAGLFISSDGAGRWHSCSEIPKLRDQYHWFLPYSPEAGCVRGFAFHADRVYAAVEVGGVLRSDDRGDNWRLAGGSSGEPKRERLDHQVHADVHSVISYPSSPDVVFAATGGGLYGSSDGGDRWRALYSDCYCRAVWADKLDVRHVVLGPANGVNRDGRIEESWDGGESWENASAGLDLPWPRCMIERFYESGDELLAITSDGRLFSSPLVVRSWRRIVPEVGQVRAVAVRLDAISEKPSG
ncbi:MAG: WD40/YVTN/BNR-like repeat-containing protein [Chloroflexota bacterium]